MITSMLSRIENYPGFMGSFDDGETWWKSEPIPNLDTILSVAWIYGEYHVCSAKMIDGSYSIWQSNDHGYTWREQVNTSERIFEVIQPDYGVALAATSGGWWRSENSGTDWSKISVQAPGCHTVKELTKNILVALDGTYVWRSANGGTTWAKAVKNGTSTPVTAKTLYPSVDGTYNDVFIGCTSTNLGSSGSNRLIYSDDGGVSFLLWEDVNTSDGTDGWRDRADYRSADVITDIELVRISAVSATPGCQPIWFIFQVLMPNGYLRHYRVRRAEWWWPLETVPVFDGHATPGKSLVSIEDNTSGTDEVRRLAIYSGMGGNQTPILKTSDDGGFTWDTSYPSEAVVYSTPTGSGTVPNPFVDDSYITYAWVHGTCHNSWRYVSSHFEKCQSYDMDFRISPWLLRDATYEAGGYVEGTDTATYRAAPHHIEATETHTFDADSILAVDHNTTYDADMIAEATRIAAYRMKRHLEGGADTTYQMGALVYSSNFPQINMPQAYRLEFPWISESGYPYDSREA